MTIAARSVLGSSVDRSLRLIEAGHLGNFVVIHVHRLKAARFPESPTTEAADSFIAFLTHHATIFRLALFGTDTRPFLPRAID